MKYEINTHNYKPQQYPLMLDLQLFSENTDPDPNPNPEPPAVPPAPQPTPVTFDNVLAFLSNASADVLFKIPAVKTLVENARAEEKTKLYKTGETKDEKIKTLQAQLDEANTKLLEKENTNLSEQEILQRQVTALTQQLTTLTDSIEAERTAAETAKREAKFEAYKERRLRELAETKTEYLPDLLGGADEEAFETSVQTAIVRYAELKAKLLGDNPPAPTAQRPSTPSVTNPAGSQTKPVSIKDIRNMSNDQWAVERERLLVEARKGNIKD